jgi:hypothetical protein
MPVVRKVVLPEIFTKVKKKVFLNSINIKSQSRAVTKNCKELSKQKKVNKRNFIHKRKKYRTKNLEKTFIIIIKLEDFNYVFLRLFCTASKQKIPYLMSVDGLLVK